MAELDMEVRVDDEHWYRILAWDSWMKSWYTVSQDGLYHRFVSPSDAKDFRNVYIPVTYIYYCE